MRPYRSCTSSCGGVSLSSSIFLAVALVLVSTVCVTAFSPWLAGTAAHRTRSSCQPLALNNNIIRATFQRGRSHQRTYLLSSSLGGEQTTTAAKSDDYTQEEWDLETKLLDIAKKLKLEIFDLDEGIFGFDSQDHRYGLEVVRTDVSFQPGGLGLVLTQVAGNPDGRGLVLISEVHGNAAAASPSEIQVGDVITGVMAGSKFRERTTGLNYDLTVGAIERAKEASPDGILTLELNRLVERAPVTVEVDNGSGDEIQTFQALAGENLRRLLLRHGVQLYDRRSQRFDMPFSTGDCAGEGLCGTCLVAVTQGAESLNPKDASEQLITKKRPLSWRASCRAVVGYDNKPANIKVVLHPQSNFADELNPGVKSLS